MNKSPTVIRTKIGGWSVYPLLAVAAGAALWTFGQIPEASPLAGIAVSLSYCWAALMVAQWIDRVCDRRGWTRYAR